MFSSPGARLVQMSMSRCEKVEAMISQQSYEH